MATYFVCSGAAGAADGTSWVDAYVSVPALMTGQAIAGGDIIYVHNTHSYVATATIAWILPESGTGTVQVFCVDGGDAAFTSAGASMGTTVGALTTGAIEDTNANAAFSINPVGSIAAHLYINGMQFKAGAGGNSSSADIIISNGNAGNVTLDNCVLWVDSTNGSAEIITGATNTGGNTLRMNKCTFRFGGTGQKADIRNGLVILTDCSISASGSSPTTVLTAAARSTLLCSGCDFSLATNAYDQAGTTPTRVLFNNCTISTPVTGTHAGLGGAMAEFHGCAAVDGTNGANVLAYYKEDAFGIVQDDQTVYVTSSPAQGSQDDGTATSYSLKMTPSALALVYQPLYTPWIYVKVASTGSKTITMKAADTESALLKNATLWLEVEYMGGAAPTNSPQSALEGTYPLFGVVHDVTAAGSDLTDSAEAWTGIAETGTYTLSKTVTLDEQGYIRCRVGLGIDTTNPVYVDPKITVS